MKFMLNQLSPSLNFSILWLVCLYTLGLGNRETPALNDLFPIPLHRTQVKNHLASTEEMWTKDMFST